MSEPDWHLLDRDVVPPHSLARSSSARPNSSDEQSAVRAELRSDRTLSRMRAKWTAVTGTSPIDSSPGNSLHGSMFGVSYALFKQATKAAILKSLFQRLRVADNPTCVTLALNAEMGQVPLGYLGWKDIALEPSMRNDIYLALFNAGS